MALELMRDEMIRQLKEQSATQAQMAEHELRWKHAMTHPGEPLPCPLCFLAGETNRLRAISEESGLGIVRCEYCRNEFQYKSPEAR